MLSETYDTEVQYVRAYLFSKGNWLDVHRCHFMLYTWCRGSSLFSRTHPIWETLVQR